MHKRRQSRLLGMAVLVPLFLGTVLPDHLRTLVCRYTGVVMPEEACCPEQGDLDLDRSERLRSESCCVVKTVQLTKLVSARRVEAVPPCYVVPVACIVVADVGLPPCQRGRAPSTSAPSTGPPIVLAKHAFLI
jgi:hypothetical protein